MPDQLNEPAGGRRRARRARRWPLYRVGRLRTRGARAVRPRRSGHGANARRAGVPPPAGRPSLPPNSTSPASSSKDCPTRHRDPPVLLSPHHRGPRLPHPHQSSGSAPASRSPTRLPGTRASGTDVHNVNARRRLALREVPDSRARPFDDPSTRDERRGTVRLRRRVASVPSARSALPQTGCHVWAPAQDADRLTHTG